MHVIHYSFSFYLLRVYTVWLVGYGC